MELCVTQIREQQWILPVITQRAAVVKLEQLAMVFALHINIKY